MSPDMIPLREIQLGTEPAPAPPSLSELASAHARPTRAFSRSTAHLSDLTEPQERALISAYVEGVGGTVKVGKVHQSRTIRALIRKGYLAPIYDQSMGRRKPLTGGMLTGPGKREAARLHGSAIAA